MQNDGGKGTSRQASSPAANDPASPLDDLDIRGLDVFFADTHTLSQHGENLIVRLRGFHSGDESGIESVMAVHGDARMALEQDVEVDQVEQHVSDDFAEV